jgi:hypothetical protein
MLIKHYFKRKSQMKKILAILALTLSSSVFAVDSFTIEGSNVDNAQSAEVSES